MGFALTEDWQIKAYALKVMKKRIELEAIMPVHSSKSTLRVAKRRFNMSTRTSRAQVVERIDEEIKKIMEGHNAAE